MDAVLEELHKEAGDKYEIVVVSIDKYPAAPEFDS
jgi:hypothetical protein